MRNKNEIIARLERIARCATHAIGESPFVMSLDDGIAVHEAIDIIQLSQREGHWIGTEYDGYANGFPVYDVYECSECGMEYDATDDGEITHNYCPNCGVRMSGEEEQCD